MVQQWDNNATWCCNDKQWDNKGNLVQYGAAYGTATAQQWFNGI